MSLQITQHLVDGFDKNCTYICTDTDTTRAVLVDPAGNIDTVLHSIPADVTVQAIALTHAHPDHYDGLPAVYDQFGPIPIYVHQAGAGHLTTEGYEHVHPLENNDTLTIGEQTLMVLHTPGHSPDSCCLYTTDTTDATPALISGDTLFVQGCGRTTPEQARTLYDSLERLKALPDETVVFPGHDYGPAPSSTIGDECHLNRFLCAPDFEHFFAERFPNHN